MKDRAKAAHLHHANAFQSLGTMEPDFVMPRLRRALELHLVDEIARRSGVSASEVFHLFARPAEAGFSQNALHVQWAAFDVISDMTEALAPSPGGGGGDP